MLPAISRSPLAIDGGRPVRTTPFPAWPYFSDDEVAAAVDVMRSGRVNYWTGAQGREFEREFAASCDCRHGVAVANGTVALELALRSLGIGPGDDVVTSSRTFVASASAISMCGARPVFADVDRESQNLCAESIRAVLTPRTRAIIAVHLAGWPCDMEPILELARAHGLFVVEDCAQSQGAACHGRAVGSFGDAAAFSFCQDKIMTTLGEGGMFTTNNSQLWKQACAFRDHGRNDASSIPAEPADSGTRGFRWVHDSLGTNWRLTEIQSAVGRLQLQKVAEWMKTRQAHARKLASRLGQIAALRVPFPPAHLEPAWYRFYAFIRPQKLSRGWDRDLILEAINAEGVPCFVGSCSEVYLEKAFSEVRPAQRLPIARELGESSLAFLVHPTLMETDIEAACRAVEKVFAVASLCP
jgi:dTDP-4-amino-4,6-dideoxygalactose transaminase